MEKSHEFKVKEGEAIVDFFKRSWKTSSSNFDVAPKGLDTSTESNSYVEPTALGAFEIGSIKIR